MNPDSPGTENDANLSGLGRALLDPGGSGSKPSTNPWVPPTAEELGRLLPEYEIVKMLGRGGMGAVYMGRQKSLDRAVAIKILSTALEGNAWEWCGDWFNSGQEQRVLGGGAWDCNDRNIMLSSFRNHQAPTRRYPTYGFRVVIELP